MKGRRGRVRIGAQLTAFATEPEEMIRPSVKAAPQLYARAIGVLYLIVIVAGLFAYGYVPGRLVSDDAAVTASNILSHELLWRAGIVASLASCTAI